ncbi:Choline-sulfatase [compost metagenome]
MTHARNALFIMCDQLRWDYLSCYGHPTIRTPNIDALARRGVRFTNAYVQSASCGPSRMSYYTGRYVTSHRSFGNFVPLPADEMTMGDYIRPHGARVAVAGKTHVEPNLSALRLRGIDPSSERGRLLLEGGFEPFDRHDGVLSDPDDDEARGNKYTAYLRRHGYLAKNPWLEFANSAQGPAGQLRTGWNMRYADLPARVAERHSETAYTTDRALAFIAEQGDAPWCLHLSYIKPHWPYVAPDPYHRLYGAQDVVPAIKSAAELRAPHPLYASYLRHSASASFALEATRRRVIPTYMGLISQVDDHLGRLFDALEKAGRFDDTLIVFCSDHGDYLGDHHLGEKELWHDAAIKTPLIVHDPSSQADMTRAGTCDALVEAVDVLPSILDALGIDPPAHVLEGKSLLPWLRGKTPAAWRDVAVSEFDYSFRTQTRLELGRAVKACRTIALRDHQWKYVHCQGMRPVLFNLQSDPDELNDLGEDASSKGVLARYGQRLGDWLAARKTMTSVPDGFVENWLDLKRFNTMQIGQW